MLTLALFHSLDIPFYLVAHTRHPKHANPTCPSRLFSLPLKHIRGHPLILAEELVGIWCLRKLVKRLIKDRINVVYVLLPVHAHMILDPRIISCMKSEVSIHVLAQELVELLELLDHPVSRPLL